jgi:hypothetical protein
MVFQPQARPAKPADLASGADAQNANAASPLRSLSYDEQVKKLAPAPKPDKAPEKKAEPVDLADPKLREKHQDGSLEYKRYAGDLFVNGVSPEDVQQGSIADCYLMAAMAATASAHPELITAAFKPAGEGAWSVRFFESTGKHGEYKENWVKVDADLATAKGKDSPAYGRSADKNARGRELWPSIMEKAYAQWKRGYDKMGEGGSSVAAMEALTGRPATSVGLSYTPEDRVWKKLVTAFKNGKAITAGTHGKDRQELYEGKRLYAWHAYTVLKVREDGKERFVTLRNPWGSSEPGEDGKDDGIFELSLADFMKYYSSANLET